MSFVAPTNAPVVVVEDETWAFSDVVSPTGLTAPFPATAVRATSFEVVMPSQGVGGQGQQNQAQGQGQQGQTGQGQQGQQGNGGAGQSGQNQGQAVPQASLTLTLAPNVVVTLPVAAVQTSGLTSVVGNIGSYINAGLGAKTSNAVATGGAAGSQSGAGGAGSGQNGGIGRNGTVPYTGGCARSGGLEMVMMLGTALGSGLLALVL